MRASSFLRVEHHLSSEGTFLMGDAEKPGFPIRYASPGFERLYGYKASEIHGKKCGELIGGAAVARRASDLHKLCHVAGLSSSAARAQLQFLTSKAAEACRVMVAGAGEQVGVSLLINRKRSGALLVCECLVLSLKHPTLNWSYCVGFQRDISKEVSLEALLNATEESYGQLLDSRQRALEQRRSVLLGCGKESTIRYLHLKALDVFKVDIWKIMRSDLLSTTTCTQEPNRRSLCASASAGPKFSSPGTRIRGAAALSPLRAARAVNVETGQQSRPTSAAGYSHQNSVGLRDRKSMMDFLAAAGLAQFTQGLVSNGFEDLETLLEMREEHMQGVGMQPGHMIKLKTNLLKITANECAAKGGGEKASVHRDSQPGASWEAVKAFGIKKLECLVCMHFFQLLSEEEQTDNTPSTRTSEHSFQDDHVHPLINLVPMLIGVLGDLVAARDIPNLSELSLKLRQSNSCQEFSRRDLDLLGNALDRSLKDCLAELFTDVVLQRWTMAYNLVSSILMNGLPHARQLEDHQILPDANHDSGSHLGGA